MAREPSSQWLAESRGCRRLITSAHHHFLHWGGDPTRHICSSRHSVYSRCFHVCAFTQNRQFHIKLAAQAQFLPGATPLFIPARGRGFRPTPLAREALEETSLHHGAPSFEAKATQTNWVALEPLGAWRLQWADCRLCACTPHQGHGAQSHPEITHLNLSMLGDLNERSA